MQAAIYIKVGKCTVFETNFKTVCFEKERLTSVQLVC